MSLAFLTDALAGAHSLLLLAGLSLLSLSPYVFVVAGLVLTGAGLICRPAPAATTPTTGSDDAPLALELAGSPTLRVIDPSDPTTQLTLPGARSRPRFTTPRDADRERIDA